MTNPVLVEQFYVHVFVQCEHSGCTEMIIPNAADIGNEQISAPVDTWAVELAARAEKLGWRVENANRILCPRHGIGNAQEWKNA
jgi:hypothetical protein